MLPRALALAQAQHDQAECAQALVALAALAAPSAFPVAPADLVAKAASSGPPLQRALLLHHLAAWLPASLQATAQAYLLDALRACQPADLVAAAQQLAPHLDQQVLPPLLAIVDDLPLSYRQDALSPLIPLLPPERCELLAQEALQQLGGALPEQAGAVLASLALRLPPTQRADLLQQAIDQIHATAEIEPRNQIRAVAALAPVLTGDQLAEALRLAGKQPRVELRAELLVALLPYLPVEQQLGVAPQLADLAAEVGGFAQRVDIAQAIVNQGLTAPPLTATLLAAARSIADPGYRARALAALVAALPSGQQPAVAQEVFSSAQSIVIPGDRLEVLTQIAPYCMLLPDWDESFRQAYRGAYAHQRAQALVRVLPSLPTAERALRLTEAINQLAQWVSVRAAARGAHERAQAWELAVAAWRQLPPQEARAVWRDTLPALATRSRSDLYLDLQMIAPILPTLAGPAAVPDVAQAVLDVSAWWP